MKALFLTSISLFAMAACTQQSPTSSSQGALSVPTTVAGSASNTTTAFDGTYRGLSIRGDSGAGPGLQATDRSTGCQPFTAPPTMTIANGLAQFQAVGATFAGYVTLQGNLTMDTGRGAKVTGNFDPQSGIFSGHPPVFSDNALSSRTTAIIDNRRERSI
jgi:hypothetical protein